MKNEITCLTSKGKKLDNHIHVDKFLIDKSYNKKIKPSIHKELGSMPLYKVKKIFSVFNFNYYEKQILKSMTYFRILEKLSELTKKLDENYDSYRHRQVLFFKIKNQIHYLWENTNDVSLRRLALRLESFVNVTKSENLERRHIEALISIFNILQTKKEEGIKEIKQIMIEGKMRTLPKIKGLTDLYKDE